MTVEAGTITQEALTSAYERYRTVEWSQRFSAPGLTSGEIVATVLGNFNYQVENGGVLQWWDNRFALEKGPNDTSAHVVLAAVASRFREVDPPLADYLIEVAAFVDRIPDLEREQGGQFMWSDEEDEEAVDMPLDDHLGGERALTRRFNAFEQKRVYAFIDNAVRHFPADENPFDTDFSFDGFPASREARGAPVGDPDTSVRYPHVNVALAGEDGNAYAIIGRVERALRRAGVERSEIEAYVREAKSGDYDHLLTTTMKWVSHDRETPGSTPGLR